MSTASTEIPSARTRNTKRVQDASEIVATDVGKTYGTGPFDKEVVKDCSFTIESNKLTVMIGPSGCGKSCFRNPLCFHG